MDEAVTALAWSLYKPEHARELAEIAVRTTGLGNVTAAHGRDPLEVSVYLDYTEVHRIEEMAALGCDRVVV